MKKPIIINIVLILIIGFLCGAVKANIGKDLYIARCAMCHGSDAKASGDLARKSNPPTPDLTSRAFQKRLAKYPGVIISSIVLQPNGTLIPDTLKKNHVYVPPHIWTDDELRSINQYILMLIKESNSKGRQGKHMEKAQ